MVGEANSKEAASLGKPVQVLKTALKHPIVPQERIPSLRILIIIVLILYSDSLI